MACRDNLNWEGLVATNWTEMARTVLVLLAFSACIGLVSGLRFFPRTVRELAKNVCTGISMPTDAFADYRDRLRAASQFSSFLLQIVLAGVLLV